MKVSVEKPGSPEELLKHSGVKGMKWGVRQRSQYAGQKAGKAAYKEARQQGAGRLERRAAYRKAAGPAARERSAQLRGTSANLAAKQKFNQKYPTSGTKAAAIRNARARVDVAHTKYVNETNPAKREQLKKAYLNHPDRATALRYTRGEKVVLGVLAGALAVPVAAVGVAGAPVAAGGALGIAGGTAGVTAYRRRVERKQARGGYK